MVNFSRTARSLLAVMLVAMGTATLLTFSATPAEAAFQQATYQCWPGPSGNACARLYYDPSTKVWRGYGAVDPNPGKSIVLWGVQLYRCTGLKTGCTLISQKGGDGPGTSYQRITTDGRGPACYWYTSIDYSVGYKTYFRDSPLGGLC